MKKLYILLIILPLLSGSCKKDDVDPVTNTTLNSNARDMLYEYMDSMYLWYSEMPTVNLTDYKDPYELLDAVRYKTLDRWSFVADYASFMASMQGSFVGHGIRLGLDPANNVRIVMIYKNSPMYIKGVRRGWIIQKLNGTDLAPIFISGDGTAYSNLIGPANSTVTNTFLFKTPAGKDSTITTKKASFQVNSVTFYDTLELKSGRTGYLVFDEFIEPSSAELKTAFQYLKQYSIKDLILDLRYNSGGIVSVATELAGYISGLATSNVFVRSKHNDKNSSKDNITYFNTVTSPLNLTRLVVICTRETASASEAVINGLSPYINIVCIGDTTNGKPTGMEAVSYNKKFIFAPITFKLVNSANFGDFYEGFPPAKYVPDDITHDFGDRNEFCLKEAIHYMETGSITKKNAYAFTRSVQFSEKPKWMNNAFNINLEKLKK
jgi:carboxyl-terminal processing protease